MLTDAETEAVYQELAAILEKQGLGWVVSQVKEQVRYGKPEEAQVEFTEQEDWTGPLFGTSDDVERRTRRRRRGGKATLTKTMPYSPRERLQLLVSATEQVAIHTLELEKATVEFATSDPEAPKGLSFLPEEFDESRAFSIEPHTFAKREEHAHRLRTLLHEIRVEGNLLLVMTNAS